MNTPRVSVIVPVLNGAPTIGDLLGALRAQAGVRGGYEILVCDNGSTDRTVEVVRRHPVSLLHERRRGPAAARNRALREARGEIIACADADTLPTRRWLAELTAGLEDPAVVQAGGQVLTYSPRTGPERYLDASGMYDQRRMMTGRRIPYVIGMNMAVRRTHLLAVGGWDERMSSGEDVDLSYRLAQRFGATLVYREGALLFHRHRATDIDLCRQAHWYGRGMAQVLIKHPQADWWGVGCSFVTTLRIALQGMGAPLLVALRAAGWVSETRAEFERYDRLWTWWFFRGFCELYVGGDPCPR